MPKVKLEEIKEEEEEKRTDTILEPTGAKWKIK